MLSNIKPRIRLLVPQAKLSVIEYIYAKFFSFDSKTNCFAARLMVVKLLNWIKI
jgi:hypothetical protein